MRKGYTERRGVWYYRTHDAAEGARLLLLDEFPGARIVRYGLGHDVQYYKSGPYFPQDPESSSPWNPANAEGIGK